MIGVGVGAATQVSERPAPASAGHGRDEGAKGKGFADLLAAEAGRPRSEGPATKAGTETPETITDTTTEGGGTETADPTLDTAGNPVPTDEQPVDAAVSTLMEDIRTVLEGFAPAATGAAPQANVQGAGGLQAGARAPGVAALSAGHAIANLLTRFDAQHGTDLAGAARQLLAQGPGGPATTGLSGPEVQVNAALAAMLGDARGGPASMLPAALRAIIATPAQVPVAAPPAVQLPGQRIGLRTADPAPAASVAGPTAAPAGQGATPAAGPGVLPEEAVSPLRQAAQEGGRAQAQAQANAQNGAQNSNQNAHAAQPGNANQGPNPAAAPVANPSLGLTLAQALEQTFGPASGQAGMERIAAPAEARGPVAAHADTPAQAAASGFARNLIGQIRKSSFAEGRTRIELAPRGLGDIEIDMQSTDNGRMRIVLRAENPLVLQALRDDRQMLMNMLDDSGLSLDGAGLDFETFSQDGRGDGSDSEADAVTGTDATGPADEAIAARDASTTDADTGTGDTSGRLDITT
ncbi:hypothetical protein BV394_05385 [Brevirhabdus pacifica]|uniref:Uncharacterized protein n=3 Tax=Brevirhabdus pacifica TaxID=1267768 RepID=A0A1U7DGU5_9RHOB|nr:flagellar hook-length control protein FliK [Brevirhabdus pacifica]APX89217.1 hypothetical protein BV394_05385 [Brevirhabdus pacifica]OWU76736.1 hypothetical protein ATO5_10900 [Loktanella sp. 22II-4b]PJJ86178.1 flagellar hook-length control protein FliK [Brevirhabdus pacifica]